MAKFCRNCNFWGDIESAHDIINCPTCGGLLTTRCDLCGEEHVEESENNKIETINLELYSSDVIKVHACERCIKEKLIVCEICGNTYIKNYSYRKIDGKVMCVNCISSHFINCEICDSYVNKENIITLGDGTKVCPECFKKSALECYCCHKTFWSGNGGAPQVHTLNDGERPFCKECSVDHVFLSDLNWAYYTIECLDNKFFEDTGKRIQMTNKKVAICDDCEQPYVQEENNSKKYCPSCVGQHTGTIYNNCYYHTPVLKIFSTQEERGHTKLAFGTEIEVTGGDNEKITHEKFDSIRGSLYYTKRGNDIGEFTNKSDSSICRRDSHGIEVVSQPRTLNSWLEMYNTGVLQKVFDVYSEAGYSIDGASRYSSDGTYLRRWVPIYCGYHIHISRDFLGNTEKKQKETLAKIIILINNDMLWNKLWEPISRRSESGTYAIANRMDNNSIIGMNFSSRTPCKTYSVAEEICNQSFDKTNVHRERYRRVNCINSNTVEFRIFKSTLSASTYMATMEIVDHLVRFAKLASSNDVWNVTLQSFMLNCPQYPELLSYMYETGVYTH